jgi:hypothetical protein
MSATIAASLLEWHQRGRSDGIPELIALALGQRRARPLQPFVWHYSFHRCAAIAATMQTPKASSASANTMNWNTRTVGTACAKPDPLSKSAQPQTLFGRYGSGTACTLTGTTSGTPNVNANASAKSGDRPSRCFT